MHVDISLLPVLAATFMLVFARVGAMVMLLPGLGESNIPVRIKLAIAVLLTLDHPATASPSLPDRHAVDGAAGGHDDP